MRRRAFLGACLGGVTAMSPRAVLAQSASPMRRIGVLINYPLDDPEGQVRIAAFRNGLRELGLTEGENVQVDYRSAPAQIERAKPVAAELVSLQPEVILVGGGTALTALLENTRSIPIVFVVQFDPVSLGFVANMHHPGGNATGFSQFEPTIGAKWMQLLKEAAPDVTRVLALSSGNPASMSQLRSIDAARSSLGVDLTVTDAIEPGEMERAITALSEHPHGGLVVLPNTFANIHAGLLTELARRHRLPAVYPQKLFVVGGGLMSYNIDNRAPFKQAASYVARILAGERPGDLPVQAPTQLELVVNLRAAKEIGLNLPLSLLARADEVIE